MSSTRDRERERDRDRDRHYHSSSSSSSSNYKDLYKELKHDLKERDRDLEDLENECSRYSRDLKKAKQDSADLWKIYHNMQTELQQSYERNAKLQAEKGSIEAILDQERKDRDKEKASKGVQDVGKLQDALIAMQKEKLEFQGKYNAIVMENKQLREKETTYGPRLRELESIKTQLAEVLKTQKESEKECKVLKQEFNKHGVNHQRVEKFRSWNSLLSMEAEQKSERLRILTRMDRKFQLLQAENKALREQLSLKEVELAAEKKKTDGRRNHVRQKGIEIRRKVLQLRMNFKWNREAMLADIRKERKATERSFQKLKMQMNLRIPSLNLNSQQQPQIASSTSSEMLTDEPVASVSDPSVIQSPTDSQTGVELQTTSTTHDNIAKGPSIECSEETSTPMEEGTRDDEPSANVEFENSTAAPPADKLPDSIIPNPVDSMDEKGQADNSAS